MQVLKLPKSGQAMEDAEILEWKFDEGDRVSDGDPVVIFETDKMVSEVTADEDGVLLSKAVAPGETVPVGAELGRIGDPSEGEAAGAEAPRGDGVAGDDGEADSGPSGRSPGAEPGTVRATPAARRRAREHGLTIEEVAAAVGASQISPAQVERVAENGGAASSDTASADTATATATSPPEETPSDPSATAAPGDIAQPRDASVLGTPRARAVAAGLDIDIQAVGEALDRDRVRESEVRNYVSEIETSGGETAAGDTERQPDVESTAGERTTSDSDQSPPAVSREEPLTGAASVMFDRMSEVNREYADTTTVSKVDVTDLLDLYDRLEESWDTSLSLTAFVVAAVARSLPEYEELNAEITADESLRVFEDVNVGIAVNADDGLLVPTIYDAADRTVRDLSGEIERLADGARTRSLDHRDLQNGTFTVSNAGSLGAYINTPQINPPQTAVLGVCTVFEEPGFVDGDVVPRKKMHLCLTYDHRVVEGATAVSFLQEVTARLQNPESLLS